MLGIGERSFRRWRDRLRDEGPEGLVDRRLGKPSARRAGVAEIARMLELYQGSYADFTVKHFHEQLVKRHGYKLGYTVTKVHLHGAGLVRPALKRSAHRKKRPRRPMVGMMLHQDASKHAWLPGDARLLRPGGDARRCDERDLLGLPGRGGRHGVELSRAGRGDRPAGLFCALYTDRGSHYFHTPKAGEPVSKRVQTQVGRALGGCQVFCVGRSRETLHVVEGITDHGTSNQGRGYRGAAARL